MKNIYFFVTLIFGVAGLLQKLSAQQFWALGYTEALDTVHNGRMLIIPMEDTVLIEPFDSPVQFESTMAGAYDEEGQLIFYTNGCHLYNRNHEIISGGEELNPGEIHDMVCDEYGYIAPLGASIVHFETHPHLYFLIHTGIHNSITHSISYGPLYLTRLEYNPESEEVNVLSKNEILINEEIDPFELIRHGNGNDWWLLTNSFGTNKFHKILLTPEGAVSYKEQQVGYHFPFPPCRWQRSLSASPSGDRLVRYSSKCGAQFYTFNRCNGQLIDRGFSGLEFDVMGGGGTTFSSDSEYVYFSRWYQIMKVRFDNPPDTLRTSFRPPDGYGGSFVHMFRDTYGRIFIAPQASEPYLHLIPPNDNDPDTALVAFEGLRLPYRLQRSIPHYPNYELGPLGDGDCDTLLSSTEVLLNEIEAINLYPNPANNLIHLTTTVKGEKDFQVLNALGEELMFVKTTAQELDINLEGYAKGIYFVRVYKEHNMVGSGRFVKD